MTDTAEIDPRPVPTTEPAAPERPAPPSPPGAAMPPRAPLAMPVQDLRRAPPATRGGGGGPLAARLFVFGGAAALTAYGAVQMYEVISVSGGATWLQYVLLVLFVLNFSWIALAFTAALLGFAALLRSGREAPPPSALAGRTAIVMPVYNEGSARVFAGLQAMHESVEATGLGRHFDWFVLSDSTQADAWIAEERAFLALREELGPEARLYYRHREKNHHRKAGNIADFVTGWGGAYDHMLVLDADSLLTGACIVHLAAAMDADPQAGIVQSLPLIINRNTLFARLQQFAARIYGPVIATGLSVWSGRDGNYWGHNAIIRMLAFAEAAGLPDLKGRPPFGGHILSHDFVEAALIRRAGWSVTMLPRLEGSYEESPPSLIDLAVRDRRWAQGNLQHARVIGAAGLAAASRQHFATGIAGYVASPLWLAQLVIGLVIVLQTAWVRPEYFSAEFGLYPVWPRFDPVRALQLFALTMGILLAPKFLGLVLALLDTRVRRASGGAGRLTLSFLIEILLSALIAPIAMVVQSGSVFQILAGRDTGWNPQRRDDGSIPVSDIVRRHRWHTALGLALKHRGLLVTPEEQDPPAIALRAGELTRRNAARGLDDADALAALHADASLARAHAAMLPEGRPRPRGRIDPDHALARAKIVEAETLPEAQTWLTPKERFALLHDRALLDLLTRLRAL